MRSKLIPGILLGSLVTLLSSWGYADDRGFDQQPSMINAGMVPSVVRVP